MGIVRGFAKRAFRLQPSAQSCCEKSHGAQGARCVFAASPGRAGLPVCLDDEAIEQRSGKTQDAFSTETLLAAISGRSEEAWTCCWPPTMQYQVAGKEPSHCKGGEEHSSQLCMRICSSTGSVLFGHAVATSSKSTRYRAKTGMTIEPHRLETWA